jgi:hypothetical protein
LQVLQGGGNMPAYAKNLSPSETTALVQFLERLHPVNQSPSADASRNEAIGRHRAQTVKEVEWRLVARPRYRLDVPRRGYECPCGSGGRLVAWLIGALVHATCNRACVAPRLSSRRASGPVRRRRQSVRQCIESKRPLHQSIAQVEPALVPIHWCALSADDGSLK